MFYLYIACAYLCIQLSVLFLISIELLTILTFVVTAKATVAPYQMAIHNKITLQVRISNQHDLLSSNYGDFN